MVEIYRDAALPSTPLYWLDDVGAGVDFSGGTWTWQVQITQDLVTTAVSGVTVIANANPTAWTGKAGDVPSITLSWAAGSRSAFSLGPATLKVTATSSGLPRIGEWEAVVK